MEGCSKDNELYHYGVVGMKWGVRRTPEQLAANRTTRKLKRRVAAGYRNLKTAAKNSAENEKAYNEANRALTKEMSRPALSQRKKRERIASAEDAASKAGDAHLKTQAKYKRAERIYDSDVTALKEHVNKMVKDYGSERVKNVKTTQVTLGDLYVKEKVKTGLTLANMPVFGTMYTGNYIGKRDFEDRRERPNRKAESMY